MSNGTAPTYTVWVKNTGNTAETLSMTAGSWSPANANTYLTLSWNREGYSLAAGASVQAVITMTIAANTGSLTSFSFNIVVAGTA